MSGPAEPAATPSPPDEPPPAGQPGTVPPPDAQPPAEEPGPIAAAHGPPVLSSASEIQVPVYGTPTRLTTEVGAGRVATFRVVAGTLPPGLALLADGTWHGTLSVAGNWLVTVEACDDQAPPECSVFSITLTSEHLSRTGMEAAAFALVGLISFLLGLALVGVGRLAVRRRRA